MKEKTVAFLVARSSSSRLPGKHFKIIGDRPLLAWTIAGLRQCREVDEIVLATVAEPANEGLRDFAANQGLPCFWYEGDVNHVTTRLRLAAEEYGADICLLISGDCPLMYAPAIDDLLRQFKKNPKADVMNIMPAGHGLHGVGIARRQAWQRADELSDRPELKEHHFPVMGEQPAEFSFMAAAPGIDLCGDNLRLSIDTWADLEFFNRLYDELTAEKKAFDLPAVLDLLRRKPEIKKINSHVHQRKLVEDIKKILFVCDAGGKFGYGHFRRSMEIGLQITERLSWPVTFMVDDEFAGRQLTERGFRIIWDALERSTAAAPTKLEFKRLRDYADYDGIILDLAQRHISHDWRRHFTSSAASLVMDKLAPWTELADMVIIPGVTAAETPTGVPRLDRAEGTFAAGRQFIIIRREIRKAGGLNLPKDIDILAYLHDKERRLQVEKLARRHNLEIIFVAGRADDFPELLARAKVYLGNFGYSFYEALFLEAMPVNWPLSAEHDRDAMIFYKQLGLPPLSIHQPVDLEDRLPPIISQAQILSETVNIEDGTPAIVAKVAALMSGRGPKGE